VVFQRRDDRSPVDDAPLASFGKGVATFEDVRAWAGLHNDENVEYPPLVWIGAPHVLRDARMSHDGGTIDGLALRTVDKLPLNRSYFDQRSVAYFAGGRSPCAARATAMRSSFARCGPTTSRCRTARRRARWTRHPLLPCGR
jgi:hypothetical protein